MLEARIDIAHPPSAILAVAGKTRLSDRSLACTHFSVSASQAQLLTALELAAASWVERAGQVPASRPRKRGVLGPACASAGYKRIARISTLKVYLEPDPRQNCQVLSSLKPCELTLSWCVSACALEHPPPQPCLSTTARPLKVVSRSQVLPAAPGHPYTAYHL